MSVLTSSFCILGLYDTVFDVDHDKERAQQCGLEPNGFSFDGADAAGVDYALNRQVYLLFSIKPFSLSNFRGKEK